MTYQKKTGLGRGLSALLDDNETVQTSNKEIPAADERNPALGTISQVKVSQIEVNPYQPRTDFDREALLELSDSIRLQGLIQPITVRRNGNGNYQLISGERRLRASKLAGLNEIPA